MRWGVFGVDGPFLLLLIIGYIIITYLYFSKLGVDKVFSPGIFNLFICFGLVINRGVYYHGYFGVLYLV